jgi:DNA-directed RNA polymerase subunit E'/Rpb7
MYKPVILEERVALNPTELSDKANTTDMDALLLQRIRVKIEGRCISAGYVQPDSLEILHRSMGMAENGRFTGNYVFYVKLRCKVFHPETSTPVECRVLKVNKMGAYVVLDEAMRVLLPRDLHLGNTTFDGLSPDDTVIVQVLRSRFQTNDPFISSVGLFISRSAVAAKRPAKGQKKAKRGGAGDDSSQDEENEASLDEDELALVDAEDD